MSRKPASKPAFSMRPLAEQVRAAMPIAREMLTEGIDTYTSQARDFVHRVGDVVDDGGEFLNVLDKIDDAGLGRLTSRIEAARAIGIALGLMIRPEVFEADSRTAGEGDAS
jgi:hypothetical protein